MDTIPRLWRGGRRHRLSFPARLASLIRAQVSSFRFRVRGLEPGAHDFRRTNPNSKIMMSLEMFLNVSAFRTVKLEPQVHNLLAHARPLDHYFPHAHRHLEPPSPRDP